MIEIERLKRTTFYPSQWEGRSTDGCPIYVWYKWHELRVYVGPPGGTIADALHRPALFETVLDEEIEDNCLDWEELQPWLASVLDSSRL